MKTIGEAHSFGSVARCLKICWHANCLPVGTRLEHVGNLILPKKGNWRHPKEIPTVTWHGETKRVGRWYQSIERRISEFSTDLWDSIECERNHPHQLSFDPVLLFLPDLALHPPLISKFWSKRVHTMAILNVESIYLPQTLHRKKSLVRPQFSQIVNAWETSCSNFVFIFTENALHIWYSL